MRSLGADTLTSDIVLVALLCLLPHASSFFPVPIGMERRNEIMTFHLVGVYIVYDVALASVGVLDTDLDGGWDSKYEVLLKAQLQLI